MNAHQFPGVGIADAVLTAKRKIGVTVDAIDGGVAVESLRVLERR